MFACLFCCKKINNILFFRETRLSFLDLVEREISCTAIKQNWPSKVRAIICEDLLVRAPIRDIFTLYILHLFTFPAVGVNLMRTIDVYDG